MKQRCRALGLNYKHSVKYLLTGFGCLGLSISVFASADDTEARIQQLEKMVLQLQEELRSQKKRIVKTQVLSRENAKTIKTQPISRSDKSNNYKFGGFIKATTYLDDFSDGNISSGSIGRDIYVPGLIPVAAQGQENSTRHTQMLAKETRLNFTSTHTLADNKKVKTFIEMDFLGSLQGNERVSNSYSPRLRHAFFSYDNWLFGQTWSTFQNVSALPEAVDFLAAPEGIVFERQAQIRYTNGPFQFALENPETTVTPYGGGSRMISDNDKLPDLVARYNYKAGWGHISTAALLRQLTFESNSAGIDTDESAFGVSITGKWKVSGKNDIRWNLNVGEGLGRYVGLNTANAAVLTENGSLEAIESTSGAIAYRHFWNDNWRSNFIYSMMSVDNDTDLTGFSVTKDVQSMQLNLVYNPVKSLTLGAGILMAEREVESGEDGDLTRLIFTAKYGF